MSELPAWSLPAGAAKDIAHGADWPAELTHQWAYGGAAGKGVRDCILDSGVDASHPLVGHVEGVASAPSTSRQPASEAALLHVLVRLHVGDYPCRFVSFRVGASV